MFKTILIEKEEVKLSLLVCILNVKLLRKLQKFSKKEKKLLELINKFTCFVSYIILFLYSNEQLETEIKVQFK